MNVFTVFQQMLILFLIMGLGLFLKKKALLSDTTGTQLSFLVINVFNPALTIYSVFGQSLASTGAVFFQNLILVGIFYTLLFFAGLLFIALVKPEAKERPIYQMLMLFPNIGFMGIPVVAALLGAQYIIYVAIYMLIYNFLFYTIGLSMANKAAAANQTVSSGSAGRKFNYRQFLAVVLNPGVASSIIALIIFCFQIPIPESISSMFNYLGAPCVPLSMLLIGCSIADSDLKSILKNKQTYLYSLFKTLLIPIAFCFLAKCLPFDADILKLFVIMASMPAGTLVALAVEQNHVKSSCATDCIIFSTLSLLITMPIVSLFL